MTTTHTLTTNRADIAYDVHGPLPTADGSPPLFMIGQPMTASGFATLASHLPDRTVITYDPRGLGRSTRRDGRVDNSPTVQASDVHAVIQELDAGRVDMFASSAAQSPRSRSCPTTPTSWPGEFTDEYCAQPTPDPTALGMPNEDDGSRDSPLLSDLLGHQQLSPRRRRAGRGAHSHRDRRGRGIPEYLHRTDVGGLPNCSVSRPPCSPATTAVSSAASPDTPGN